MAKVAEPLKTWDEEGTMDAIGPWSEVKLDILKRYATEYSTIISRQEGAHLRHIYIDAFAGGGRHYAKNRGEVVSGSPLRALEVFPPFVEYHFVEKNEKKVKALKRLVPGRKDVWVHQGDCNQILFEEVFLRARFEDFARGLCFLDPYGLHLDWKVIQAAGSSRSIELFINFPIQDINRNVLRRNPEEWDPVQEKRMTLFWGDESWKDVAVRSKSTLFGEVDEKITNDELAGAFRDRLQKVARFPVVPRPCAMRNKNRAIVYYLFFAAHKEVAGKIVRHIFKEFGGVA